MDVNPLISDLKEKESIEKYWDFRKNDRRDHVHSLIKYPAAMVPNMQGEIFDLILKHDPEIHSVLDPFMGAGTILVEGMTRRLDVIGIDINPLSFLTVNVKIQKYSVNLLNEKMKQLFDRLDLVENRNVENHWFNGIEKWYKPSVIQDLSKIRLCILQEPDVKYRQLFWVTFAEIAKQADNSRTSTFKLHIKTQEKIEQSSYNCYTCFREKLMSNVTAILEFKRLRNNEKFRLYIGDTKNLLRDRRRFPKNSVDLVMTSPPYGDNATTITYGQYSVLPLRWIPLDDIHKSLSLESITSLNRIDHDSLGGTNYSLESIDQSGVLNKSNELKSFFNALISDGKTDKARKVASFILDFSEVIARMEPIVKPGKLLVFTVGNRHVNKMEFPMHLILKELSGYYGLDMKYDFRRNIIKNKNYVDTSVQGFKTINKETIMIFQK